MPPPTAARTKRAKLGVAFCLGQLIDSSITQPTRRQKEGDGPRHGMNAPRDVNWLTKLASRSYLSPPQRLQATKRMLGVRAISESRFSRCTTRTAFSNCGKNLAILWQACADQRPISKLALRIQAKLEIMSKTERSFSNRKLAPK